MTLGERVAVLHEGRLQQLAPPRELYARPANLFVAGFIGSPAMNFLPGTLKRANGTARVEFAGGASVPAPRGAAGEDGQRVIFGTRPEHMTLGGESDGLAAAVVVIEPTGADTQVFSKFGDVELTSVFRERHEFTAGEAIRLVPDHDRSHLFDAATGRSMRQ